MKVIARAAARIVASAILGTILLGAVFFLLAGPAALQNGLTVGFIAGLLGGISIVGFGYQAGAYEGIARRAGESYFERNYMRDDVSEED